MKSGRMFTVTFLISPNERFIAANRSVFDSKSSWWCLRLARNVREVAGWPQGPVISRIPLFLVFCQILAHLEVKSVHWIWCYGKYIQPEGRRSENSGSTTVWVVWGHTEAVPRGGGPAPTAGIRAIHTNVVYSLFRPLRLISGRMEGLMGRYTPGTTFIPPGS